MLAMGSGGSVLIKDEFISFGEVARLAGPTAMADVFECSPVQGFGSRTPADFGVIDISGRRGVEFHLNFAGDVVQQRFRRINHRWNEQISTKVGVVDFLRARRYGRNATRGLGKIADKTD